MMRSFSPEILVYVEILATLAVLAAAAVLTGTLKRAFAAFGLKPERPAGFLMSRLALPIALLAITTVLRIPAISGWIAPRPPYVSFLRALFLFSIVFLVLRLGDAAIRNWYARRGQPFVLPRVLHGFILAVIYFTVVIAMFREFLGDIRPYLTTSAILTAILGLALQGVLSNILSGMSLHFTRAFSHGDWVKIGEVEGVVQDTNWRETRVVDRASNLVVFPNNVVASSTVVNFSLPEKTAAITMIVKAGFEAAPADVLAVLKEAARETPDVAEKPAPIAYLLSYDEYGMTYSAKFWITDYARKFSIQTEVGRLIWSKFRRRGIGVPVIMTETFDRIADAVRPEAKAAAAAGTAGRNARDIAASPFLRRRDSDGAGEPLLTEEEISDLAKRSARLRFGRGEVLFRQGDVGESCYLVAKGRVKGTMAFAEDGKRFTSEFEIGPGGIVGEMSLFTGLPRTATISVAEDAEMLEIRAEAFAGLLERNPALAESVAQVVGARNVENLESLKKLKELSAKQVAESTDRRSILEHLKRLVKRFRN